MNLICRPADIYILILWSTSNMDAWWSFNASCNIILLLTVSVQWKRLATSNDPPAARAYHSMTSIGSRYLLFGGFDGKTTFGDLWWLVPEGITIWMWINSFLFFQVTIDRFYLEMFFSSWKDNFVGVRVITLTSICFFL